jgi:uncharacterized metal-binding protein YceD (DUF177 family)
VSPVSYAINVAVLPQKGRDETITADAAQLEALAAAHDLLAADSFEATVHVRRWQRDGVRLTGAVRARVTQECVVSLEPVASTVKAEIDAVYVPEGSALQRRMEPGEGGDLIIDAEGPDLPEPFEPPMLDIGAVAEEFFALALDPYPRAPGVAAPAESVAEPAEERENPFAALKALREKGDG